MMTDEVKLNAEQEYINKLRKGKSKLSQDVIIWIFALIFSITTLVVGILDYKSDYHQVTTTVPIVETYTTNGVTSEYTYYPVFGSVSIRNQQGGFLPEAISMTIHEWIILSIIILIAIPSIFLYQRVQSRQMNIDKNLPYLLREIADSQSIGMTLPRAISEAAKRNYGPMTKPLKKLAAKVSWGIPFSKAMMQFRDTLDTPLAKQATILILEAERSGGELEKIFDSAQVFVQEVLDIKQERANSIKPYIYIVYMSYVIFAVVVFVLFTTFFAPFGATPIQEGDLPPIPLDAFKVAFLYLLIIQAFFSGLTAGKMGTGKIANGLFHSMIMMTIGLALHKFVIIPQITKIQEGP